MSFTMTRSRPWALVTDGVATVKAEGGTRKVNTRADQLHNLQEMGSDQDSLHTVPYIAHWYHTA